MQVVCGRAVTSDPLSEASASVRFFVSILSALILEFRPARFVGSEDGISEEQ